MSVQRLRDELDVDEEARPESRAAGAAAAAGNGSSRPVSAARPPQRQQSAVGSRRGSLHELIRPAGAGVASEGADAGDMGEALPGERDHSPPSGSGEDGDGARAAVTSPLPGAIEDGAEEEEGDASLYQAQAPRERIPSASGSRDSSSSRSSQRRRPPQGESGRVAYTTTLEEDAERDAQELLARQRAEMQRIEQEDVEAEARAQSRQREAEEAAAAEVAAAEAAAAAAAFQPPTPIGATVPLLSRAPSARRQASSSRVADLSSMIEPTLRSTSAANNRDADSLPGDAEGASLMDAYAAAAAEEDLIAPPPRPDTASPFPQPSDAALTGAGSGGASAGAGSGRQRRKYNPSVDFGAEPHLLPSPSSMAQPVSMLPSVEQAVEEEEEEESDAEEERAGHAQALLAGSGAPASDDAEHAARSSSRSASSRARAASLRLKASSAQSRSRASLGDATAVASPSTAGAEEDVLASPSGVQPSPSRSAFRSKRDSRADLDADVDEGGDERPLASPSGMLQVSEPLASPSQAQHQQDQQLAEAEEDEEEEEEEEELAQAQDDAAAVPSSPTRSAGPTPPPVFERVVRKYPTIEDPLLELRRIRAYKDFESDFDDLVLPSFTSDVRHAPSAEEEESAAAAASSPQAAALLRSNPLKEAYDAVHDMMEAESRAPLPLQLGRGRDPGADGADDGADAALLPEEEVVDPQLLEDVLGLGHVSLEEAAAIEAELEAERIESMQSELARRHRQEHELTSFAAALSAAHIEQSRSRGLEIAEKEHQLLQKTRLLMKEEQESFRRAEDRMRAALLRRGATLRVQMQDLKVSLAERERELREIKEREERRAAAAGILATGGAGAGGASSIDDLNSDALKAQVADLYAAVRSRRYEVAWNYEPRLVRLRVDWIRCLKNKLPAGNYQVMVTLYDRLGGTPLRWSTGTGDASAPGAMHVSQTYSHTGATVLPQKHAGRYYNTDLCFNQRANRIFLACPPLQLSRPSMVFVFELFLCGDQSAAAARAASTTSAAAAAAAAAAQNKQRGGMFASVASGAANIAGSASVLASELLLKARDPKQYALLKAAQANAAAKALQRAPPSSDRVVAWGAFPMSYINFDIIRGSFKVPLLRGAHGAASDAGPVEKFQTIHERIGSDLDAWLANLYFDVRPWPRLLDNAVENTVALNFTGARKKHASDGSNDAAEGEGEDSSDEEEDEEEVQIGEDGTFAFMAPGPGAPADGTVTQVSRRLAASGSAAAAAAAAAHAEMEVEMLSMQPDILVLDEPGLASGLDARDRSTSPRAHVRRVSAADEPSEAHRIDFMGGSSAGAGTPIGSLSAPKPHRLKPNASSMGSAGDAAISKRKASKKNGRHEAVTSTERRIRIKLLSKRFPGMLRDIPDVLDTDLGVVSGGGLSGNAAADLRNQRRRAELCKAYKYNVDLPSGEEEGGLASESSDNPLGRKAAYKLKYIANELWADMGIVRGRGHIAAMVATLLLVLALLWVRVFSHNLGQYLFLSSVLVPITRWECGWYSCAVGYVADPKSITAQTQIGVVAMGVVSNLAVTLVLMAMLASLQRSLGRAPQWMSQVLIAWSAGTIVEPLLILLIDVAQGAWTTGDSFKLYQYYLSKDGNGVAGIFMTILIYMLLIVVSTLCFYLYVIEVHMNGRILDVHYRLHGGSAAFHVPHDLEISVRELRWILLKARRWVGLGGQKRKVQVSKFLVRDPLRRAGPRAADLSIYVAIYTQSLTGDVELFRHFVRGPCGRICEIFDSFDTPGEEGFKKIEEKLTSHERRLLALQALAGEAFAKGAGGGGGGAGDRGINGAASPLSPKPRSLLRTNVNLGGGGGGMGSSGGPGTPGSGALVGKARFKSLTLGLASGSGQSSLGKSSISKISQLNM